MCVSTGGTTSEKPPDRMVGSCNKPLRSWVGLVLAEDCP